MTGSAQYESVFSVVVTFNPDDGFSARLRSIRQQVQTVVVVDNGSANAKIVEATALDLGCSVLMNEANLGIAKALNQGILFGAQFHFKWMATFDQDSVVPADEIPRLLAMANELSNATDVAILAMSHWDRGSGRDYHRPGEILKECGPWREVRTTITSGSFIRMSAFNEVGLFDEKLFIDMVDIDFCMRCRIRGHRILECRAITLKHSMGDSKIRYWLGRPVVLKQHAPIRRYYIMRNQLEMCRRYMRADPRWALGSLWDLISRFILVLMFEECRWKKFRAMLAGTRDFALRRFGPRA